MKITAPYNFVPLNKHVFYPDWAELVTQDLPFSDSEDGVIEVKLKNVSPLFTRDGAEKEFSAHIMGADGKRLYFIPATTFKGMLREIVETMSFGKMQEDKDYQNKLFGYRDVKNVMQNKYMKKVNKAKPGWLTQKGDKYYFTPCKGKVAKIPSVEVKELFPSYHPDGSIWKSNVSVAADENNYPLYPEIEKDNIKYQIVCSGQNDQKKNEILFPFQRDKAFELAEDTISVFKKIYAETPGFASKTAEEGCFLKALEKGREIPVFHVILPNGQETIGFSRMFKLPYQYDIKQQVEFIQKAEKNKHDLGEILFGYTADKDSLKGRVQASHAFMEGSIDDNSLIKVCGVLGKPKASYYPLYIKQKSNLYKTYDNQEGIAGRKLYRIHSKGTTTQLPKPNVEQNNIETTFYAIPKNQVFTLRLSLHNVKETEIGAILSALTFNLTPGVYFNLGLAKSFGFGKCTIDKEDIHLRGFSHDLLYYMHSFERMMTEFNYELKKTKWAQAESIKQLVNILSEHEDSEVKMMEINEYGNIKDINKNPFNLLTENEHPVHSLLTDEELEEIESFAEKAKMERRQREARLALEKDYNDAENFLNAGEYQKAKDCFNTIIDELLKRGINSDEENQKIAKIEQLIAKKKEEEEKALAEQAKQILLVKLAAGLGAILDKKAGNGVDYSIKEFKVCFQKVDKWLKDSNSQQLSEQDATALYNTSVRLLESPFKKEVKELNKPFDKGNIWCKLVKYLGADMAKLLYDSYLK